MTRIDPVRFEEGRAMLVAGLRRLHAFAESAGSIPAQWRALAERGPIPGQVGATAYGVVCGASHDTGTFEYMSGHEVASFDALPHDLGRMRVPVQRYAVFVHEGHVSGLRLDRDGAIWAATEEGGLSRIKNGRVSTLTTANGLPCDVIHWSLEDDHRSLWMYTA